MKLKKMLAVVVALCTMCAVVPFSTVQNSQSETVLTAYAKTSVWNGTANTSWYYKEHKVATVNGKDVAIFNISTAEELAGLAKLVRNGNTMENTVINLTADIALNDTSNFENWNTEKPANNWTAIGAVAEDAPINDSGLTQGTFNFSKAENFSGTFNGNGHTISGMYSEHHCFAGLFAQVTGVVSGVVVKDSMVKCLNTQEGLSMNWVTCAGGIVARCDRGIVNCCEFDGKVIASGLNPANSTTTHGCYAGGIVGLFDDDSSGLAAVVTAFFFTGFGVIFNPVVFLTANGDTSHPISNPGIYNCINRGSVSLENGTYENGAGGIVGTGGLSTFRNPDFAVFSCLNLGSISADGANADHVAAMVGNGTKFQERDCYYTNASKSSTNNAGTNFTEAGMSKQDVAEALGSAFKYENDDIYLNFDNYEFLENMENARTETFSRPVKNERVTLAAPSIRAEMASSTSKSRIRITCESPDTTLNRMELQVSLDPYFTDICATNGGGFAPANIKTNLRPASATEDELVPGRIYYIRARGRTTFLATDSSCEYTDWAYLNVKLEDYYGSLSTWSGELVPEPEPEEPVFEFGDLTDDGVVNAKDAAEILVVSADIGAGWGSKLTEKQFSMADVNKDGNLNAMDAAKVLIYSAEFGAGITNLPLEEYVDKETVQ